MNQRAEEFFVKEYGTGFHDATLSSDKGILIMSMEDIYRIMEQYASQPKEEGEVESGWVIVDPDYKELWETFRHLELDPRDWFGDVKWDSLTRQGYKCVRAERVTRLKDTTKTKEG